VNTDAARASRRRRLAGLTSVFGIVIAVAGLAFLGRTLVRDWDQTQELLRQAEWAWLALAVPMALLGMTLVGTPWRRVMAAMGEERPVGQVLRWYFPGQLGKYVPGAIWPVVGRGEMAYRGGVNRGVAYVSVALSLALTYLAASLTAIVLLIGSLLTGQGVAGAVWVLLLLPAGLAMLHPAVLQRLVTVAERVLSRDVPVVVPPYGTIVRLLVRHVPAWLAIASATWLVARAFTTDVPVLQVMFAAVLSWIVGFVVVPVPGGIGVREAAFAAAATSLPDDVAATVAIVARLCFIASDLIGAGLVVLFSGWRAARAARGSSASEVSGTPTASPSAPPGAAP
jgi:uncharacterized membrane protein YbhN (UPF0104 family)